MKKAGITIKDLHLSFGPTEVLKGVNLDIKPGEFFAFLGPSGSGKSTLLRSIAGFGPRPKGSILIGDKDVVALDPWKRNVGMVFQSYALWPHMSVRDNVAFGLRERRMPSASIATKVREGLELVGLAHLADRMPNQLSGGQQQRVALARTVVTEPEVLLLDEPLSNLDASLRVQMRRELLRLQRKLGLTTIFVTHDQEEANTTSDRMAVLDGGVIQQIGTGAEIYNSPATAFVASFVGENNPFFGTVTRAENGHAVLDTAFGPVRGRNMRGARPGDRAILFIRPEGLRLGAQDASNMIDSEVLTSELEGSMVHVRLRGENGKAITISLTNDGRPIAAEPGTRLTASFDPDRAVVLPHGPLADE